MRNALRSCRGLMEKALASGNAYIDFDLDQLCLRARSFSILKTSSDVTCESVRFTSS